VSESPQTDRPPAGTVEEVLHLGSGFSPADRPRVLNALANFAPHLSRWDPADLTVDVSVKDRDGAQQQVTLRADLPGYPPLVAKAANSNLDSALVEAKRELVQQIEAAKKKREPKSNRRLRKKTT
jgi:ribosome-associated translation inhibitor RaiA